MTAAAPPASPAPRRARWPWWLGAAVLLAAAAFAYVRLRPPEVAALQPLPQPLVRTLQFSARVQTPQRVELGATVTGRVANVMVREGDAVPANAPLVLLEADEARAALAQAEAALAQAAARRGSQQAVARPAADAALAQAEAGLLAAERDLARTRELVAQQFLSTARLDDAQRALDVARAQRDGARAAAQANRASGPEVQAAQAQFVAAQAAVQAARARLDQLTLRAPAAGRVILRGVEPGQIVQPGRALVTLAVTGATELVAPVDERFLSQLQPGQRAAVVADAFPQQAFAARVARVAPSVDAQRGAVEVYFALEGTPPAFLREDMTLSVEVVTGERASARVLPLRVLRAAPEGDRAQVLVAVDGRAALRDVRLGLRTLDRVEVVQGLADGDLVLADPTLAPGARVRAKPQEAAAAGTSRDMAGPSPFGNFGR